MNNKLLELMKLTSEELKIIHSCNNKHPYLKIDKNDNATCGYCDKKLYDNKLDKIYPDKDYPDGDLIIPFIFEDEEEIGRLEEIGI